MKDNFLENENPELYLKLGIVQKTLNAPKNLFNKFGKYKYRSCEGILEAVKPLLDGCTVMLSDSIESVLDRVYVKATATFTDGISKIEVTAFARESETKKGMDDSQITGTASSYARKYALNGLFLIDDTKDADDTNKHETLTASQFGELETLLNSSSLKDDERYRKEIENLSPDRFDKAKSYLLQNQLDRIESGETYSAKDIQKKLDEKGA